MQLPALPKPPAASMAGPTPWSNWVIPGLVIAGAYPASLDDAETERILTTLLELGINTFVCLQAEVNINIPDISWRSGHGLRPYIRDAQRLLSRARDTCNPRIGQQKIDFLHLPIIDGNVTTDSAVTKLAVDCCERVLRGEKLYIHCWGGHGRTGTLVAIMLGRLYGLPYTSALRYTQAYHDTRVYPQGVRSPQTPVQRAQVRRVLGSNGTPEGAAAAEAAAALGSPVRPMRSFEGGSLTPSVLAAAYSPPAARTPTPKATTESLLQPVRNPLRPGSALRAGVSPLLRSATPVLSSHPIPRASTPTSGQARLVAAAAAGGSPGGGRYGGAASGVRSSSSGSPGAGGVDRLTAELARLRASASIAAASTSPPPAGLRSNVHLLGNRVGGTAANVR